MASATFTIRAMDLATPLIRDVAAGFGAVSQLLSEREERITQLEDEAAQAAWEAAWADATGRPWGWAPPSRGRWDVTLDGARPYMSRVLVEDVPVAASGVTLTADANGVAVMRIDVPLVDVDLHTVRRQ